MKNLKVNVIMALVALLLAALVLPQPAAGASADYTYRPILPDGYQSSSALSLNESGLVVGKCRSDSGVEGGFLYSLTTGDFMPIMPKGWKWAAATCINESGLVVGSGMDGSGTWKGFIYDPVTGIYTELLPKGWAEAWATHINDKGTVVGYGKRETGDKSFTSFIYRAGNYGEIAPPKLENVRVTAINNSNKVVGTATATGGVDRGFLYDPGTGELTIMDPGGWTWTGALNINQLDEVAGWGEDALGNRLGYLYSEGDYTELSHAALPYTVANDVSDTGLVVGTFNDTPGYPGCIGFIFDSNTSSYIELNAEPSWFVLAPGAINATGVVAGFCRVDGVGPEMAFVATPPEMPKPLNPNLVKQDAFVRNLDAYEVAIEHVAESATSRAAQVISNLK